MSQRQVDNTIAQAFQLYSDVIPLDFKQVYSGTADIVILFKGGCESGLNKRCLNTPQTSISKSESSHAVRQSAGLTDKQTVVTSVMPADLYRSYLCATVDFELSETIVIFFIPSQLTGTFTLLMGGVESWLMLTLLDGVLEGTHTSMMMKPGLLPEMVNTVHTAQSTGEEPV